MQKIREQVAHLAPLDVLTEAYHEGEIDETTFHELLWAQGIEAADRLEAVMNAHLWAGMEGAPSVPKGMEAGQKATDWYKKFPRRRRTPVAPKLKGHPLDE